MCPDMQPCSHAQTLPNVAGVASVLSASPVKSCCQLEQCCHIDLGWWLEPGACYTFLSRRAQLTKKRTRLVFPQQDKGSQATSKVTFSASLAACIVLYQCIHHCMYQCTILYVSMYVPMSCRQSRAGARLMQTKAALNFKHFHMLSVNQLQTFHLQRTNGQLTLESKS